MALCVGDGRDDLLFAPGIPIDSGSFGGEYGSGLRGYTKALF